MNKFTVLSKLISSITLLYLLPVFPVQGNPLLFNPTQWGGGSMVAMPMMIGPQFDSYAHIPAPGLMLSPFGPMPYETDRRSNPVTARNNEKGTKNKSQDSNSHDHDDQKAMDDLPVSFVSIPI